MATGLTEFPAELRSFDVWLALHKRKANQVAEDCVSCGKAPAVTDDDLCVACAKYTFGYDQAQRTVAGEILAGAVRGALATMVPAGDIVAIVQGAITADRDETVERMLKAVA